MRVSKFIKPDVNILMEYIYDDSNLISEPYEVLVNIKDNKRSFISTDTSITNNLASNQLFLIDPIDRTYGKVDTTNYSFLQINNYASGFPLRFDTINIHLPINYTFIRYIGMYLRVYSFDFNTQQTYELSNFYFDISDSSTLDLLDYTNPPLLFQEKLWGKHVTITIPSLYQIANQRVLNVTTDNSVNYNLTNGVGMSQVSPIFFEFSFIDSKQTINGITTYNLTSPIKLSLPQVPEFETLGVMIQHSSNGDYFEIFGIYNNTNAEFKTFMDNSVYLGNRYYVKFDITLYEQNIRGKTLTIIQTDNFNEIIDYRPIIRYSTTTAVIDVAMYIIDSVDNSQILRSSSYGMLQDQVSKYSLNLTKINLKSATKPKIYNLKSATNINGLLSQSLAASNTTNIQTVKIPFAVLMSQYNIVAKSDNAVVANSTFYGEGKLIILLKPFDNVIKITIASNILSQNNTLTPQYMDLTGLGQIQLVFKNNKLTSSFDLYQNTGEVDLGNGTVVFKISASKINDIRTIYNSGINVFYITSTQNATTTVVYSGLFKLFDSTDNINSMNAAANQLILNSANNSNKSNIIPDNSANTGVAIVTRVLTTNISPNVTSSVLTTNATTTNVANSVNSIRSVANATAVVANNSSAPAAFRAS